MNRIRTILAVLVLFGFTACNFPGANPGTDLPVSPTPALPTAIVPTADPGVSGPVETNLALHAPATATNFLSGFEPGKAVDGIEDLDAANWWSAGDDAPQRIEIDLGGPAHITRIRLVVSQDPPGETLHLVLGRRPGETSQIQLGQLAGATADGDALVLEPDSPWHGIRYVTVQTIKSPSWVAWREIEVFGVPGESVAGPGPTNTPLPEPEVAADLIFTNGLILTMDPFLPLAEAIAIRGDRILAVGSQEEIAIFQGSDTAVVDLAGRTVAPGFIDSHAHRIGDRWLYGYGDQGPEQAIQEAIEGGWTSLHELFVGGGRLEELAGYAGGDALRVRVSAYLTMNFHYDRDDWWTIYEPLQAFSAHLQIAGLKITLDQEWGETVFFNQAQMTEMVGFAADQGWQVATHAFVPQTNMMVLNAYEAAVLAHPEQDFRFRLEHIGVITDEGIQKMADLGVIGSVQFINTAGYVEDASFIQYVPEAMWPLVSRWRDMIEAGVLLIGNTDSPWCCTPWRDSEAPVITGKVMDAIYGAVTRRTYSGREPEPWQLSQVVSVAEALEMLTIRGAYAAHQEDVLGSLAPGKYADLVVLSANPLEVPVHAIPGIEVLLTMIGGKVEYCPPGQGEICP